MTYKKTIKKRKKRGGANTEPQPSTLGTITNKISGALHSANQGKNTSVKAVKKGMHTIYRYIAEFAFKATSSKDLNFTLIKKLFGAPTLRVHKYKESIELLNDNDKLNYKAACKLLYIHYFTEYVKEYNFIFDKAKSINDTCIMFHILDNQMRLFNSSTKKALQHFDIVFRNNKFQELYNNSLPTIIEHLKKKGQHGVVDPVKGKYCTDMRNKIEHLFIVDGKNYSYIILYILYDLYKYDIVKINNKKSVTVLTEMFDELKNEINKGRPKGQEIVKDKEDAKISKFEYDEEEILNKCDEKKYIDLQRLIINNIP
jgi:hypothetical protein